MLNSDLQADVIIWALLPCPVSRSHDGDNTDCSQSSFLHLTMGSFDQDPQPSSLKSLGNTSGSGRQLEFSGFFKFKICLCGRVTSILGIMSMF